MSFSNLWLAIKSLCISSLRILQFSSFWLLLLLENYSLCVFIISFFLFSLYFQSDLFFYFQLFLWFLYLTCEFSHSYVALSSLISFSWSFLFCFEIEAKECHFLMSTHWLLDVLLVWGPSVSLSVPLQMLISYSIFMAFIDLFLFACILRFIEISCHLVLLWLLSVRSPPLLWLSSSVFIGRFRGIIIIKKKTAANISGSSLCIFFINHQIFIKWHVLLQTLRLYFWPKQRSCPQEAYIIMKVDRY